MTHTTINLNFFFFFSVHFIDLYQNRTHSGLSSTGGKHAQFQYKKNIGNHWKPNPYKKNIGNPTLKQRIS